MTDERYTWGKCDRTSAQGWSYRRPDRRFWTASWSGSQGSLNRDGKMTHRQHAWRSRYAGRVLGKPPVCGRTTYLGLVLS